ncbi:hypothetical protein HY631_00550 [Candidatus Uhrbacteria bacterium]|nr:hypothetical protein [Candidatus Uhrbacteria bacterium]
MRISFFLALIVFSSLSAAFLFRSNAPASATAIASATTAQSAPEQAAPSQSKDGIDVTVASIDQREDATVLTLDMNNHRIDLSEVAIYEQATLNGTPSNSYTFLVNGAGGHHVKVELAFPATDTGTFTITPDAETVFTFDNLWR